MDAVKKYLKRHLGGSVKSLFLYLSQFLIIQALGWRDEVKFGCSTPRRSQPISFIHQLKSCILCVGRIQYFSQHILQNSDNPWKLPNHILTNISPSKEV